MRKSIFMMLLLTVLGMAMSCEREVTPNRPIDDPTFNEQASVSAVKSDIVGMWVMEENRDTEFEPGVIKAVYRFGKDGIGSYTLNWYNTETGQQITTAYHSFTFECADDVIRIVYSDGELAEKKYTITSSILTIYSDYEDETVFVYHKKTDADSRFLGNWSTTRVQDEFYYVDNITFATPTDCYMYSSKYDNPMAPPVGDNPALFVWYKYTFDDEVIYITVASNMYAKPMKKYYRIDGNKLYLSDTKGGIEICYTTIHR